MLQGVPTRSGSKRRGKAPARTSRGPQGLPTQATSTQRPAKLRKPYVLPSGPRGDAPQTRKADQRKASTYTNTPAYKQALVQVGAHRYGLKYDAKSGAYVRKVKGSLLGIDSLRKDTNVAFDPLTGKHLGLGNKRDAQVVQRVGDRQFAASPVNAGVLKILNETTRLAKAQPSALHAALHGKNPVSAGGKAFLHNKGPLYGDVFQKDLHIPKVLAHSLGFVADVGSDPTTYFTGGLGSIAERTALKEAERVAAKAARAGMSEAGVASVKRAAYNKALKAAPKGRGVTAKFAGAEVPGVRTATAKVGRGVGAVAKKAPGPVKRAATGTHGVARDFRPSLRPAGTPEGEFRAVRQAGRKARAESASGAEKAQAQARALKKHLDSKEYAQVIDAIERGRIAKLPDHLHEPARVIRDTFRGESRARRQAGIAEGVVGKGRPAWMSPQQHQALQRTIQTEQRTAARRVQSASKREAVARASATVRERQATSANLRDAVRLATENPGAFPEADHAVMAFRAARSARTRAQKEYSDAQKAWRNAHQNARSLYSEADRATRTGRVATAKYQLDSAKQAFQAAEEHLRGVSSKHETLRTSGQAASVVSKHERRPSGPLARLEHRRGVLMEAQSHRQQLASGVLKRRKSESEDQYLRRLQAFARRNDLPRLDSRTAQILAKRPPSLARGYFPHVLEDALNPGKKATGGIVRGGGGRNIMSGSSRARSDKRPISQSNPDRVAAGDSPFSTDVPAVTAKYRMDSATVRARAHLNRAIADSGRDLKPGDKVWPKQGEAIYHIHGAKITRVPVKHGDRWVYDSTVKGGRYVVANARLVEDAVAGVSQAERSSTGAAIDRMTGGFKRVATFTPGFHVRNLIGDAQMGYLTQPGHRLPANMAAAAKGLHRVTQVEKQQEKSIAGAINPTNKTIKIAGKPVPLDEFLKGAREHGVIRSGYISRELEDLAGTNRIKRGNRVTRGAGRLAKNINDNVRLATYKDGLDRGLSPAEAADRSLSTHIDYGDLTRVERKYARRLLPFYTFSARSVPLHAQKLLTNPGKYAAIEKARQESGAGNGKNLYEFQQRQAPFVIGKGKNKRILSAGLPLAALNEIPTSTSPGKYIGELSQFGAGLLNPLIKDPAELYANRSFFFRRNIEDPKRPLVAAPSWVGRLPKDVQRNLGVVHDYVDKRTGKRVLAWPGKQDYISKSLPGLPNQFQQLATSGVNRRGQGLPEKVAATLTGIRADPPDPAGVRMSALFTQSDKLTKQQGAMNQRGINSKNSTPAYRVLQAQIKRVDSQITALSRQRGDKLPLLDSGRKSSGKFFSGASSSGKGFFDDVKQSHGKFFDSVK